MRGDFSLHFGAWLLITATLLLLIFGFSIPPTGLTRGNPARTFFYGVTAVLSFSLFCSVMGFFVIPAIVRLFKSRTRRIPS
jgi:hypothetical protein